MPALAAAHPPRGALGFVAMVALSLFGIGALLQASLVWLSVLKWVGGAYLVWLGVQVWRLPPIGLELRAASNPLTGWVMFRKGALSAATNPKGSQARRRPSLRWKQSRSRSHRTPSSRFRPEHAC